MKGAESFSHTTTEERDALIRSAFCATEKSTVTGTNRSYTSI